ncbi:DHH family phosphoesterase [[Acholeplasma] multilocale]|uniref:DHH family phosphoesterase n=1 Tax=[Acholeplasma] multilocale TaxID=264638 RepID=UPI00047E5F91|nr:bifunctional oligoribonuclease/PAP phosphatase NrnA [[Acholeplasma] multilocale]
MNYLSLISEKIQEYNKIIIHRHIIPDGDAYGSQLGLKYLITSNFPDKQVFVQGEDIEYLKFIGLMDEKISDDFYKDALVIVTDCGNVERIDDQRFSLAKEIIKIDHHPDATPYGDISWVDTTFTSASEMVGYLAKELNWIISPEAARVIYHGICTDSGRFLFRGTTSRTFEVCARLFEEDFDWQELYNNMYESTFEDLELRSELITTAKVTDQGLGYIILTDEMVKKYNIRYEENGKFSNILKNIKGIDVWITFAIREDGRYRVEFRSKELTINSIAVKWGGGGHALASGAIIDNLDQAMQVIDDMNELIRESKGQL